MAAQTHQSDISFVENNSEKIKFANGLSIRLNPIGKLKIPDFPTTPDTVTEGMNYHFRIYLDFKRVLTPDVVAFVESVMGGPDGMTQALYWKSVTNTLSLKYELRLLKKTNKEIEKIESTQRTGVLIERKEQLEDAIVDKMRLFFHPDDLWMVEDREVLWHAYNKHVQTKAGIDVIEASEFFAPLIYKIHSNIRLRNEIHEALSETRPAANLSVRKDIASLVRAISSEEIMFEWGMDLQNSVNKMVKELNKTLGQLYDLKKMPDNGLLINNYEKIIGFVRGLAFVDSTYKIPKEMRTVCEIVTEIIQEWMAIATGKKTFRRLVTWGPTIVLSIEEMDSILSDSDVLLPYPQIATQDNFDYARYFLERGCGADQTGYLEPPSAPPAPPAPATSATRRARAGPANAATDSDSDEPAPRGRNRSYRRVE